MNLTICTSVMPTDKVFIDLNWKLITELNGVEGWKWLVVDNSEESESLDLESWDDCVQVISGVATDYSLPEWCQGSYHHAAALNKALSSIDSRFAMFLDPDFFVVRPDWMRLVTSYMDATGLAILGVPWHPKWYTKYRYFPCAHALFIDLDKIAVDTIDFTPSVREVEEARHGVASDRTTVPPMPSRRYRRTVANSNDTGYPLYRRYAHDPSVKWDSMTPLFRPAEDFRGPGYALSWYGRALEKILPEKYCLLPKRSAFYSEQGFHEFGRPDVGRLGWEEFLWDDAPFGFHMRRYRNAEMNAEDAIQALYGILTDFCPSCSFDDVGQQ